MGNGNQIDFGGGPSGGGGFSPLRQFDPAVQAGRVFGGMLSRKVVERTRSRILKHLPQGAQWQTYPAKVGRWRPVITDEYTSFGKVCMVFYFLAEAGGIDMNEDRINNEQHMLERGMHIPPVPRARLRRKIWNVDFQRIAILDPQSHTVIAEHDLLMPYNAQPAPANGDFTTDPGSGIVTVQYLGDPRRSGLLLPYGVSQDTAIPAVPPMKTIGRKGRVGPWLMDHPGVPTEKMRWH